MTNSHPDHIGSLSWFQNHTDCKIYASEGEKRWIENIDLQFKERPIPNFYALAGKSARVDVIVRDGDTITLEEGLQTEIIRTAGHSADGISYRIGDAMKNKLRDANELMAVLKNAVVSLDIGKELPALVDEVCRELNMGSLKSNSLFAATVNCLRQRGK